jgi:hypothetical protein
VSSLLILPVAMLFLRLIASWRSLTLI